jgi:hypothetical protein
MFASVVLAESASFEGAPVEEPIVAGLRGLNDRGNGPGAFLTQPMFVPTLSTDRLRGAKIGRV